MNTKNKLHACQFMYRLYKISKRFTTFKFVFGVLEVSVKILILFVWWMMWNQKMNMPTLIDKENKSIKLKKLENMNSNIDKISK